MKVLPKIEVCLSPALLYLYDTSDTNVVIIDIFRATSTIVTALDNGAKEVIPTSSIEQCIQVGLCTEDSITAGEREGKVAEGLEYGNSPLEYSKDFVQGKSLVLTTTNGTKLLHMVEDAYQKLIGSFLNLSALCDQLIADNKNVLLACAAWKDKVNLEDSLFAGAVVDRLQKDFEIYCDSGRMCLALYKDALHSPSLIDYLKDSTHYQRLSSYGIVEDMEYATKLDLHPTIPIFQDNKLIPLKKQ